MIRILFLLFASFALFANEDYSLYVTESNLDELRITTSDGVSYDAAFPRKVRKLPQVGTEIYLSPILIRRGVQNERTGDIRIHFFEGDDLKFVDFYLDKSTLSDCLTVASVEEICIEPAGWFTNGVYRYIIELSDGSQWNSIKQYSVDSYVIVSKNIEHENWLVIFPQYIAYQWNLISKFSGYSSGPVNGKLVFPAYSCAYLASMPYTPTP